MTSTPTLLIDLDDTLLGNNIDDFLPVYLQALSKALADWVNPKKMVPTLLAATAGMVANRRPECTLQEVFDQAFFPALELDRIAVQDVIDRFYAEVFLSLGYNTRPVPEAVPFVETALERGYRLAVTTNPLFPRPAILHRLAWAGLPVEKYPFELVTSYETFHFTKPSPAFYAEVLARLAWPDGPVVVIGDDPQNDITPARQLGLLAYQVQAASKGVSADAAGLGSLAGVLPWLESLPEEPQPDYSLPSAILAILRATPAALDTFCRDIDPAGWQRRPAPDEWSPTEIICHLRDVEQEVNLPRLDKVLSENNPFIAGKDTDRWAEERNYMAQNGLQALRRFMASRLELLDRLENMPAEDWQRPARHAIFGPTQLAEIISIIAGHDRLHGQQIFQALK